MLSWIGKVCDSFHFFYNTVISEDHTCTHTKKILKYNVIYIIFILSFICIYY